MPSLTDENQWDVWIGSFSRDSYVEEKLSPRRMALPCPPAPLLSQVLLVSLWPFAILLYLPPSLTCRIHGVMDELWRCKMAAQTMDGRRTNAGREREGDRSNFTLFYTKAQLPNCGAQCSLPRILGHTGTRSQQRFLVELPSRKIVFGGRILDMVINRWSPNINRYN